MKNIFLKMKSIFFKVLMIFVLINVLGIVILSVFVTYNIRSFDYKSKSLILTESAEYISDYVKSEIDLTEYKTFRNYVSSNSLRLKTNIDFLKVSVNDFIFFITESNGALLLSAGSDKLNKELLSDVMMPTKKSIIGIPNQIVQSVLKDGYFKGTSNLNNFFKEDFMVYAMPIKDKTDDTVLGFVVTAVSNTETTSLLSNMINSIIVSTVVIIIASFITLYFSINHTLIPIRDMRKAAKKLSSGDFKARISEKGSDEIAELAKAFNNMAESLEKSEELRRLFISNISHELRTPMTTISGFIDSIIDGAIPPEQQEYYLGIISSEIKRLSRLVTSMLDITKIQTGTRQFDMKNFNICEMTREIIIANEKRIEDKNLDVRFEAAEDTIMAYGDPDAIHEVIYNLIDNAIKYSYDKGEYLIEIYEESKNVVFSIYNEGKGIEEGDLPYVFDRFYKSDKSRGLDKTGLGLGLYISKTIINAHSGDISAQSEVGKWCRFTFSLPVNGK